jgi:hypothetical protein
MAMTFGTSPRGEGQAVAVRQSHTFPSRRGAATALIVKISSSIYSSIPGLRQPAISDQSTMRKKSRSLQRFVSRSGDGTLSHNASYR